jgi:hypothetical protein
VAYLFLFLRFQVCCLYAHISNLDNNQYDYILYYSSQEKHYPLGIMLNDEQQIQEQIQQLHKQEQNRSFYREKCMKVEI